MQGNKLGKVCDKNKIYQTLWDAAKAGLREKFINENACIREEISQINKLVFHLKKLEREEQAKPKSNQKKVIGKSRNQKLVWFFFLKVQQNWQMFG